MTAGLTAMAMCSMRAPSNRGGAHLAVAVIVVAGAGGIVGCGSAKRSGPDQAVVNSFQQLRRAAQRHDVGGVCSLITPANATNAPAASQAQLQARATRECKSSFGRHGELDGVAQAYARRTPGKVTFSGNQARLALSGAGQPARTVTFVRVADRWRLAFQSS